MSGQHTDLDDISAQETPQQISEKVPDLDDIDSVQVLEEEAPHRRGRILLTIELIILILILLLSCAYLMFLYRPKGSGSINEGGITWIRSVYGIPYGPAGWDTIRPASVSMNPGGNTFWVADAAFDRIIEFDMNGQYKRLLYTYGDGQPFYYPTDIEVGPDGTLYVAEETYNHVVAITPDGDLKFTIAIESPSAIVAGTDMIVVGGRGGFAAYETDGTLIGVVGGPKGQGIDQFDSVQGLAMDDQYNLFVVDTFNNRLSKFDKEGDRIWIVELGVPGNAGISVGREMSQEDIAERASATMQMPSGITIDAAGRLLIADNLDFTIAIFNPSDGAFLGKYGVYGEKDGQLFYPNDIAYSKTENAFVVTEPNWGRYQIFTIPGSSTSPFANMGRTLNDLLRSCCWPLLLLLLLVAIWAAIKRYRKYRDEQEAREAAEDALEDAGRFAGDDEEIRVIEQDTIEQDLSVREGDVS